MKEAAEVFIRNLIIDTNLGDLFFSNDELFEMWAHEVTSDVLTYRLLQRLNTNKNSIVHLGIFDTTYDTDSTVTFDLIQTTLTDYAGIPILNMIRMGNSDYIILTSELTEDQETKLNNLHQHVFKNNMQFTCHVYSAPFVSALSIARMFPRELYKDGCSWIVSTPSSMYSTTDEEYASSSNTEEEHALESSSDNDTQPLPKCLIVASGFIVIYTFVVSMVGIILTIPT